VIIAVSAMPYRLMLDHISKVSAIDVLFATKTPGGIYVCRILRLAHLAPSIVGAILASRHPPQLTMKDLMKPFPLDWREQERWLIRTCMKSDQGSNAASPITNALERQASRQAKSDT
jgi:hypothetical protein